MRFTELTADHTRAPFIISWLIRRAIIVVIIISIIHSGTSHGREPCSRIPYVAINIISQGINVSFFLTMSQIWSPQARHISLS